MYLLPPSAPLSPMAMACAGCPCGAVDYCVGLAGAVAGAGRGMGSSPRCLQLLNKPTGTSVRLKQLPKSPGGIDTWPCLRNSLRNCSASIVIPPISPIMPSRLSRPTPRDWDLCPVAEVGGAVVGKTACCGRSAAIGVSPQCWGCPLSGACFSPEVPESTREDWGSCREKCLWAGAEQVGL